MIVIHDYKTVYVDPPKTGSQTLDQIFKSRYRGQYIRPGNGNDKHCREIPEKYNDYQIVASVRNPYERIFSLYMMDIRINFRSLNIRLDTFDHFLDDLIKMDHCSPHDCSDMTYYRYFSCSKYLKKFPEYKVIHMETIQDDLSAAGFSVDKVPAINRGRYSESWQDENFQDRVDKINQWAGDDFQYGYDKL